MGRKCGQKKLKMIVSLYFVLHVAWMMMQTKDSVGSTLFLKFCVGFISTDNFS